MKNKPLLSVRRTVPMNTGERVHKSAKDYKRRDNRIDIRKLDNYCDEQK